MGKDMGAVKGHRMRETRVLSPEGLSSWNKCSVTWGEAPLVELQGCKASVTLSCLCQWNQRGCWTLAWERSLHLGAKRLGSRWWTKTRTGDVIGCMTRGSPKKNWVWEQKWFFSLLNNNLVAEGRLFSGRDAGQCREMVLGERDWYFYLRTYYEVLVLVLSPHIRNISYPNVSNAT